MLYPQDFIYLTGLLVITALSLFLFTAVAGRLWCGFACPQTVYTEIFLWIEHKVEGDRVGAHAPGRRRLSLEKLVRKWLQALGVDRAGLWTGFTFVGYFTPIRELGGDSCRPRMGSWEVFWVLFYGFATYGNAGFMREQVCKYMCPYARFQSAMFDRDTLIVSYDAARGEPRGARSRKADPATLALGDCVDCSLCVQVCPTGIDIRQGLQYECIGCGACVDVCDTVMDKMGYPRGLIRYHHRRTPWRRAGPGSRCCAACCGRGCWSTGPCWRRCASVLVASLAVRTPLKVDVVRDRAALSRIVAGGKLENVYRLQIMNATEEPPALSLSARRAGGPGAGIGGRGRGGPGRVALGGGAAADSVRLGPAGLPSHSFQHRHRERRRPRQRKVGVPGAPLRSNDEDDDAPEPALVEIRPRLAGDCRAGRGGGRGPGDGMDRDQPSRSGAGRGLLPARRGDQPDAGEEQGAGAGLAGPQPRRHTRDLAVIPSPLSPENKPCGT